MRKFFDVNVYLQRFDEDVAAVGVLFLTLLGAIFLLVFGVLSWVNGKSILAATLLIGMLLGIGNAACLIRYRNIALAKLNMVAIIVALSLSLVITGGIDHTGILWTYPLMVIAISIMSVKQNLLLCPLFLATCALILFSSQHVEWFTRYSTTVSTRFLVTSLALYAISILQVKIQEVFQRKLRRRSMTDSLTGAYNRSVITEIITGIERRKSTSCTGLLLLDVDNFKLINDTNGHDIGDQVLIAIAQLLKSHVRDDDFIIRWGGEEFLIILSHAQQADSIRKAESIRHAILTDAQLKTIAATTLSVSIGVAQLNANDFNQALNIADQNLYQAKNAGRNRVIA